MKVAPGQTIRLPALYGRTSHVVNHVLFEGTSQYVPSTTTWRELLVFSDEEGCYVLRDRTRATVEGEDEPLSVAVEWKVFQSRAELLAFLASPKSEFTERVTAVLGECDAQGQ